MDKTDLVLCVCVCVCVHSVASVVPNSATLWTVTYQALLSMGLSRQEYWSGLPLPLPGDLPNPGSPTLQADSLLLSYWESSDLVFLLWNSRSDGKVRRRRRNSCLRWMLQNTEDRALWECVTELSTGDVSRKCLEELAFKEDLNDEWCWPITERSRRAGQWAFAPFGIICFFPPWLPWLPFL